MNGPAERLLRSRDRLIRGFGIRSTQAENVPWAAGTVRRRDRASRLDADGEVRIVGADLVGHTVQGEGQPAVELIDARELTADDLPGDHRGGAG